MKKMLEPSPASALHALVVRAQRKFVARVHQASFERANNYVPTAHGMSRISTTRMIPDAPTDADAKALLAVVDEEQLGWWEALKDAALKSGMVYTTNGSAPVDNVAVGTLWVNVMNSRLSVMTPKGWQEIE